MAIYAKFCPIFEARLAKLRLKEEARPQIDPDVEEITEGSLAGRWGMENRAFQSSGETRPRTRTKNTRPVCGVLCPRSACLFRFGVKHIGLDELSPHPFQDARKLYEAPGSVSWGWAVMAAALSGWMETPEAIPVSGSPK